ncbi:MAG: S9 family peptidase [Bacteroidetes bacterium]|nr:MAG: S9 family peptidase [Bacteroidota bacterium]
MPRPPLPAALALLLLIAPAAASQPTDRFEALDVFELERAVDPRIAPDGEQIVYVRSGFDVMTDRPRTTLWILRRDGTDHRPLVVRDGSVSQPRWSPDGHRLAYVASNQGRAHIFVRWMDTGQEAPVAYLPHPPGDLSWSPDGRKIAFSMFVAEGEASVQPRMPAPPDGADWGPAITLIDRLTYRADGGGYLERGYRQLFVLPVEGGTPRQLTSGPYDHSGPLSWTPDGEHLIFSANRHPDGEMEPMNSEVYALHLVDGTITPLTERFGPDTSPAVSPDGRQIAYVGFDDRFQGYQVRQLYVMDRDGRNARSLTTGLDRSVSNPTWSADGRRIYFQYDTEGTTRVAYATLDGQVTDVAIDVGGLSVGRPYSGGQFSLAADGTVAFTYGTPYHPAEVAVTRAGQNMQRLTHLNEDVLGHRQLGEVEMFWYPSSHDGRRIQGWIIKPPGFDSTKTYPLILEIHGGPFANYGSRFAAELQLMAAAGYVVLYTNPRGSTSYGEAFGNLIHHAYPGHDYDDLMSGVDALIERGYIDEDRMFVTGGSGGGVLTAWIIGNTDRFRAAVVQKPVINWYSFVLYADNPAFFYRYWFPGPPWEHEAHYMARSPISLVGNVQTPTMLITGEVDYRTPIPETEQYYAALKLRGVEAAMVRVPDASHGIASRPSNLVAKVGYILAWFERYGSDAARK